MPRGHGGSSLTIRTVGVESGRSRSGQLYSGNGMVRSMPVSVQMPQLGETVAQGTITRWLKREGDHVELNEPLLQVSIDKVDAEIPSPATGVLARIVVGEDETALVGDELAIITGAAEADPNAPSVGTLPALDRGSTTERKASPKDSVSGLSAKGTWGTGPLALVAYILVSVFFFVDHPDVVSRALSAFVFLTAGFALARVVWASRVRRDDRGENS